MFIGFLPKLVLRSALKSPFNVPNFSPIQAQICVLWWILRSVRNEKMKKKQKQQEIKMKLCYAQIAEIAEAIFFKVGM